MNFEEWSQLTAPERAQVIRDCNAGIQDIEIIKPVLVGATTNLSAVLGAFPDVIFVRYGMLSDTNAPTPVLFVYTRLRNQHLLQGVPEEFFSLKVIQRPIGDVKTEFVETWTSVLKGLCGWESGEVLKRMHHLLPYLEAPEVDVMCYRGPLHFVAQVLVDAFAPDPTVNGNRVPLEQELKTILQTAGDQNWTFLKARVADVFQSYGISWNPNTPPLREVD